MFEITHLPQEFVRALARGNVVTVRESIGERVRIALGSIRSRRESEHSAMREYSRNKECLRRPRVRLGTNAPKEILEGKRSLIAPFSERHGHEHAPSLHLPMFECKERPHTQECYGKTQCRERDHILVYRESLDTHDFDLFSKLL